MKKIALILCVMTMAAMAAKYVDPLNGDDANDGSLGAPWQTLININNLADTVYISNSAVCYFGAGTDRNPIDVTLLPWGDERPTIVFSNTSGTASIYMNRNPGAGRLAMRNLKIVVLTGTTLVYPRFAGGKTVDVENCEFDLSAGGSSTRRFHLRTPGIYFRFWSNLVYSADTSSGYFINNEEFAYVCDVRYNRFYDFSGANPGIMYVNAAGVAGIVANNTAWGCNYLMFYNQTGDQLLTNVNNIVKNAKITSGKQWFRSGSATARAFADYTFSGDTAPITFDSFTVLGPSNVTGLSEAQLAFANTSDVTSPDFLKLKLESVAAVSAAQTTYPDLGLPPYAGWAAPLGAPTNAILSVTPDVLELGTHATNANFGIANAGIGALYWTNTVVQGGAWLSVAPAHGTQSGLVTVFADRSGLAFGSHTGRIAITANGDVTAQYVTVHLTQSPAVLSVAPQTLDFAGSHALLTFNVNNAGAGTLYWTNTVASGAAWLTVSPPRGMQAGVVSASVNRASVMFGAHTGTVIVTANGSVAAATVTVYMVKSAPNLAVAPLALDFGIAATVLAVQVWNDGEGTVGWTALPGAAWLAAAPASGTATSVAQAVSVAINRAALAPSNSYHTSLQFISALAETETVAVAVSTWPPGTSGSGYLRVRIVGAHDPATPMPGRLIIFNSDSNTYVESFITEEGVSTNRWGYIAWPFYRTFHGVHHPREARTYRLPAAAYTLTAGRGMSWHITNAAAVVTAHATTDVTLVLQRVADTEARGWYCGDAHVHLAHGSPTFAISSNQFMLWGEAAGMNWLSLAQEYLGAGQTNLEGQQAYILPMSNATFQCWMGGERPKSVLGHLAEIIPSHNPFTVLDDPPYYIGTEQVRQQGGVTYPVHADRTFGATPFLNNNFYKTYPFDGLLGPSFDAWSVASNSERGYNGRQLGWWYALLDRGARLAAMADSDYGFDALQAAMSMAGNWLAYVNISGQVFSIDNICTAIREGRTFATTGPLLFFSIGDAQPGDTLATGSYTARIETYLPHNTWLQSTERTTASGPLLIEFIELVRNGTLLYRWNNLNIASTTVYYQINETDTNAYYTVHVKGNDQNWIAAIASPIYFDNRPLQQKPFMTLVEGRAYDAFSGAPRPAVVEVTRYGATLGQFATSTGGFFRARMPLDADMRVLPFAADTGPGPLPTHRAFDNEDVFTYLTTMDRGVLGGDASNYSLNRNTALGVIDHMVSLVSTVRWDFPLRYQFRNSYVLTNLAGDLPFTSAQILATPPLLTNYSGAMCAMLIVDKYEVAPGDTINYCAIFRAEGTGGSLQSTPYAKLRAWQPYAPSSYGTWGAVVKERNSGAVSLGNGYYAYFDSMPVPLYATNCYQGPGLFFDMYTGDSRTFINLYINVGATKRGVLVSAAWPGMPIAWPNHLQNGLGPANLTQSSSGWNTRYNDYRSLNVRLNDAIDLCPNTDMAMCADTDDAYFYEWACIYSEGLQPRDPVRPQPAVTFPHAGIREVDPFAPGFGGAPPQVSSVSPGNGTIVMMGWPVALAGDYTVFGKAVSNVAFIVARPDGAVLTNATRHEFVSEFTHTSVSGTYTWVMTVTDDAGMQTTSAPRTFDVIPEASLGAVLCVAALCAARRSRRCQSGR